MKKYYDKINNLNIFIKLAFIIIFALIFSFIVTNYNVITKAKGRKVSSLMNNIQEINNFKYEGDTLVPTSDEASIIVGFGEDYKYINRYLFDYEYGDGFVVKAELSDQNYYGMESNSSSDINISNFINLSENYVDNYVNNIKLTFNGSNYKIKNLRVDNSIRFNEYTFIYTLVFLLVILLLMFPGKTFKKLENKYLLIAVSIGSLFILCEPQIVGISLDEHIHYSNIYNISFIGEKNISEAELLMMDSSNFSFYDYNNYSERKAYNNLINGLNDKKTNISTKSSKITNVNLNYLPMAIVYGCCQMIHLPFVICLFFTKFINLLIFALCMYFTIKIIPFGKRIITLIALFPTCIFLSSHFSYDPTVIGFISLGLSLFFKEYLSSNKLNSKNVILSIILILYGCFPKIVYIPLVLLHTLYRKEKYNNQSHKIKSQISIVFLFIVAISSLVINIATGGVGNEDPRGGATNSALQLQIVKNNPFAFARVYKDTPMNNFLNYAFSENQLYSFGYIGRSTKIEYSKYFLFLFIFVVLTDVFNRKKIDNKIRIVYFILYFLIYSVIFGGMYLSFNPVGNSNIEGVQPRYFIPLLFPLLLLLRPNLEIKNLKEDKYDYIVSIIISLILLGTLYDIVFSVFCF